MGLMKKKIVIDLNAIKEPDIEKDRTFLIRIESKLGDAFQELCEEEFQMPTSKVIRILIREVCKQKGYLRE
jgi:hypothetical protein